MGTKWSGEYIEANRDIFTCVTSENIIMITYYDYNILQYTTKTHAYTTNSERFHTTYESWYNFLSGVVMKTQTANFYLAKLFIYLILHVIGLHILYTLHV